MTTAIRSRNRSESMAMALAVALGLHALIITQLHFDWLGRKTDSVPRSLDVILVQHATETPPEEADFLAQASQRGGGDNPEPERPSAPPAERIDPLEVPQPPPDPEVEPEAADRGQVLARADPDAAQPLPDEEAETVPESPDSRELMEQSMSQARLAPDSLDEARSAPDRPRRKFISANTREHLYAAYMRSWVAKVERIGNMNYPEAARRRNLEGSLVLSVDVLADGSVEQIRVLRSSGIDLLDEAAVRIVRLASPYAELPPEILAETDILTITRTWQFSANRGLR